MIHLQRPIFNSILSLSGARSVSNERSFLTPNLDRFTISKRMTAPAKPKQMSPFGLVLKFLLGLHRLQKLKNIQKRPELRFWFTRWTLRRGPIEI